MRRITSNTRSQEEGREEPPAEPSEGHAQPTPGFWTSSLQNDERIHFCCIKATQFVLICYKKETNTMAKCFTQKTEYQVPKTDFFLVPNRYGRHKAWSHTAWVQICRSLAVGSWASYFTSLYCSFLTYKMGTILPTSRVVMRIKSGDSCEVLRTYIRHIYELHVFVIISTRS